MSWTALDSLSRCCIILTANAQVSHLHTWSARLCCTSMLRSYAWQHQALIP